MSLAAKRACCTVPQTVRAARLRRIALAVALALGLSVAALALPPASGPPRVFLNLSASMPLGLYRVTRGEVEAGSLVEFPSSVIPHLGLAVPKYLLKRVLATGGEDVIVNREGLRIGGVLVAKRVKDIGVRFQGRLARGEVLVLGENPRSFDSRYFGPVRRRDLTRVAPILTW